MSKLPNAEFEAPAGCTVNVGGVIVRLIAGPTGVEIVVYYDNGEPPYLEDWLPYDPEENKDN